MFNDRYEQTSVCEVIETTWGKKLLRLADVDTENNVLINFDYDKDSLWYFENRQWLPPKEGPNNIGNIGVWNWTAVPNKNDPTKDYISSVEYDSGRTPTELVIMSGVDTLEELVRVLRDDGIDSTAAGIERIYCIRTDNNRYEGIRCQDKDFSGSKIKPDRLRLPVIELSGSEIINSGEHNFLRSLDPLPAKREEPLHSPIEIVKNSILERCKWKEMKAEGFSKKEFQHVNEFLKNMPDKNLLEEISNSCLCSVADAKAYVDEFLRNINKYLNADDIDSHVVDSIIKNHQELNARIRNEIEQQWEAENSSKIAKEHEKLDAIARQFEERQKALNKINAEISAKEEEQAALQRKIKEKQQYENEVEAEIEKKFNEARENAAVFVADMVFSQPIMNNGTSQNAIANLSAPSFEFTVGKALDNGDIKEDKVNTLLDCEDILEDELQSGAGVAEEHCAFLASLLMSAWDTRIPLLIAGPNASAIADALSVSIDGKMADRIQCIGKYSKVPVREKSAAHGVIVVENVFSGDWIDHIQNIMPDSNSYYIFTNPFAEDLVVEPRGLYNYMLPLFTEPYIDDVPTLEFSGGILDENYTAPQSSSNVPAKSYEEFLKSIGCNKYLLSRIQKIIRALASYKRHSADRDYSDWDYYTVLAYVSLVGANDKMLAQAEQDGRITGKCKNLIEQVLGTE